jgi:hypothetical protein
MTCGTKMRRAVTCIIPCDFSIFQIFFRLILKGSRISKKNISLEKALEIIQINEYNDLRKARRINMEYLTTIEMSKRGDCLKTRTARYIK